jgi:hypothetical protein
MTNFSTNQVMQFYVVDSADAITILPYEHEKAFKIHFNKLGVTSDKIENVEWAKLTKAAKLQPKAKKTTVTFADDVVVGQDYAVKVSYPEVGGAGVESWTTKTAVAYAGKGATKETVVAELVAQLTKILGVDGVLTVAPADGGFTITPNVENVKYERGVRPLVIPDFNVAVNQITDEGELTTWATLDVASVATSLASGYKLADMEYFAMGERGDEYRMVAYPNHIVTDYKIVPTEDYDVYNVHYSYKGANNQSHKAEKDLIIAVPAGITLDAEGKDFEGAITALGATIVTVGEEG